MPRNRILDQLGETRLRELISRGSSHEEAGRLVCGEGHASTVPSERTIVRILAAGKPPKRAPRTAAPIGAPTTAPAGAFAHAATAQEAVAGATAELATGTPEALQRWADRLEQLAETAAANGEVRSLAILLGVQQRIVERVCAIRRQDSAARGAPPITREFMELAAEQGRAALNGYLERLRLGLPERLTPGTLARLTPEQAQAAIASLNARQTVELARACRAHEAIGVLKSARATVASCCAASPGDAARAADLSSLDGEIARWTKRAEASAP